MIEKHKIGGLPVSENVNVPLPAEHKPELVIWNDLVVDDCDRIDELSSAEEVKYFLAARFNLENYESDIRVAIVLDLYYYAIQFAKSNGFDKPQMSSLFSIVKNTHEIATETSFGNLQETFKYFRDSLIRHSVSRPPFYIGVFTPDQTRLITEYIISTYFRHFKLYKYAFTPLVKLDLRFDYPAMPQTAEELAAREVSFAVEAQSTQQQENDQGTEKQTTVSGEHHTEKEEELSTLKHFVREEMAPEIDKLRSSLTQALKDSEERLTEKLAKAGFGEKTSKSPKKK